MRSNFELDVETAMYCLHTLARGQTGTYVSPGQLEAQSKPYGLARSFTDATFRIAIVEELLKREWVIWSEGGKHTVALTEKGKEAAERIAAENPPQEYHR